MREPFASMVQAVCAELKSVPGLTGIILFGSLARDGGHRYSDINLYCIGEGQKERLECFERQGIPVQVLWRSPEDFQTKLKKRTRSRPLALTGRVLYDAQDMIQKKIDAAGKKAKEQGPRPLSSEEKTMIQLALTQDIKGIDGLLEQSNEAGALVLTQDLLVQALDILYDGHRWWKPATKYLIQDCKEKDPRLGEEAEGVLLASSWQERLEYLYCIRERALRFLGGEKREYTLLL